jgi:hypothetical protein
MPMARIPVSLTQKKRRATRVGGGREVYTLPAGG